jgi:hypothetical protein
MASKEMLLSLNAWQLAGDRCQQTAVARDEFKKPVYKSKFTKHAEWMSFVNSLFKQAARLPV